MGWAYFSNEMRIRTLEWLTLMQTFTKLNIPKIRVFFPSISIHSIKILATKYSQFLFHFVLGLILIRHACKQRKRRFISYMTKLHFKLQNYNLGQHPLISPCSRQQKKVFVSFNVSVNIQQEKFGVLPISALGNDTHFGLHCYFNY